MAELPDRAELAPFTTSMRSTSSSRYWLKSTVEPVLAVIGKPSISTNTWSELIPCKDNSKPDLPSTSRSCRPGTFSSACFSVPACVRSISSRVTTSVRTGTSSMSRSVRVPVITTSFRLGDSSSCACTDAMAMNGTSQ